jgi:hypothetical protein
MDANQIYQEMQDQITDIALDYLQEDIDIDTAVNQFRQILINLTK